MKQETDRDKFVRLATARVNKTLKSIQLIGNLSNKSNYQYTDADIEKIFRSLTNELRNCRQRFEQRSDGGKTGFRLDE
ncbi:hypothetical protein [Hydrogenophaga intermedia]|uniref:hypothetical protein n=1 Tax=Hydrogenophaga intermedia TaxID=65786 RepID=UPI0020431D5F|nr:hypothetical protein [Hydrogenophaga intermedia]MCM3566290.1 hypothetical protein [Hydrogenophaga intermedia]